jgi:hypothetical protein
MTSINNRRLMDYIEKQITSTVLSHTINESNILAQASCFLDNLKYKEVINNYSIEYKNQLMLWGMKNNSFCDIADPESRLIVILEDKLIYDIEDDCFIKGGDDKIREEILDRLLLNDIPIKHQDNNANFVLNIKPTISMEYISVKFTI